MVHWRRISEPNLHPTGFLNGMEGSASSLPTDIQSILVTTSAQAITIPVALYKLENGKITKTAAHIDSRATICCIDLHLVQRIKWPLTKILKPMYARNTNGTHNTRGVIQYKARLSLWINQRETVQDFYVLDLGRKNNIILGYPWLTKHNPQINWKNGMVHLMWTPVPRYDEPEVEEQKYFLQYLGACQQHNLQLAAAICQQQKLRALGHKILGENHPSIRRLILSTSLAQATAKVKHKLPPQYAQFAKVFNEPKAGKLPSRWLFNYVINLKGTFIPKVAKAYPLNPKEIACKEFIDKHQKSGKIQKSQSPQASPFFLYKRRMRAFTLARTTNISINTWSRTITISAPLNFNPHQQTERSKVLLQDGYPVGVQHLNQGGRWKESGLHYPLWPLWTTRRLTCVPLAQVILLK